MARIRCGLPNERAKVGVTDIAGANRYLEKRYRRAHNTEFAVRAAEPASAFVEFIGANLGDVLCERFERTVGNDNCVRFNTLRLQIPAYPHRAHYVKAKINVQPLWGWHTCHLLWAVLSGPLQCRRQGEQAQTDARGVMSAS